MFELAGSRDPRTCTNQFFAIKDTVLATPAGGALEGISRKTTIELALEREYKVIQGGLSPKVLVPLMKCLLQVPLAALCQFLASTARPLVMEQ